MLKQKLFFPNLDGLRFIAFLVVFIGHSFSFLGYNNSSKVYNLFVAHFLNHADLGVNFFFVLSGFLITHLLLLEQQLTGTVSIKRFYLRRMLRIWPVYFIVVAVGFLLIPNLSFLTPIKSQLHFPIDITRNRLPFYLFFLANNDILFNGITSLIVTVLWSVSVEEQFYLIWPLILSSLPLKRLPAILISILVISFIYRFCMYQDSGALRYSSFSVMSDLATGALVSYYCFTRSSFTYFIENLSRRQLIMGYLIGMCFIPLSGFSHIFGPTVFQYICPFEATLFSIFFAFVILEQNYAKNSFYKMGKNKQFTELGKISYGLYSYHMIAALAILSVSIYFNFAGLLHAKWLFVFEIILSLTVTIMLSKLSYAWIEKKCINLKNNLSVITKE